MKVDAESLARIEAALRDGSARETTPRKPFGPPRDPVNAVRMCVPRAAKSPREKLAADAGWAGRGLGGEPFICVTVPVKTRNPLNLSGKAAMGWRITAAKRERDATALSLLGVDDETREALAAGCVVTLTRVSAGKLDDDAVPATLKHIRDQIAVFLLGGTPGQRDSDPRIAWSYGQLRGPAGAAGVVLSIRKA